MTELIEKLKLKATDYQFGQTFVNGIIVYLLFDDYYLAECNSIGEPTPGKCIVWSKDKPEGYKYIYADLMKDIPLGELKVILNK